ncbi:hypothetical protein KC19_10G042400 [Ceratodon purpureus]|uniref:Protein kinase domain-containing protein n=1 Tax=Ceratodon purpureus TaxID=3225 RepID=A0A8T0GNM7_CERPU|nr:hypothetical protein KC19_10G042400 [Ceratodon purpureus]
MADIDMAASSSTKPMELAEPISQVSEALRIIEDVTKSSSKFLMNKHQCESLARRLVCVIGEPLKELQKGFVCKQSSDTGNKMEYPAFDVLLTVLKAAAALLSKYTESKESITSVLTRTEDREAFKEIHAELDMLNSQFPFEDFECTSESMRSAMLTGDANEDKNELSKNLHEMIHSDECRQAADEAVLATTLEKLKLVVSERSEGTCTNDDLPSFLNINPATVEIMNEVRPAERLSEHDPKETDGWARVRNGRYLGCDFALKVFKSGNTTWNRSELLKEVRSLMELHHPHIVQLMGFAQDEEKCIFLMELMDTDLRNFMKRRPHQEKRPFTRAGEMNIITQIAKGMHYLHEQQYVHGELKCSNILVNKIGDHIDVKISDLRSSQKLGVWDHVLFKERSRRRRPRWTAPEANSYGETIEPTDDLLKKTDVYSFGMVCYEVLTGKLPFQDIRDDALKTRIETGDLNQELPGELDEQLRGLIKSCWSRNPNDRPTFETICHLLDDIRFSQRHETVLSSGISTVLCHFKRIPDILRAFRAPERNMSSFAGTTYGDINVGDGMQHDDCGGTCDSPITLPEFVRIEPAKLKRERLLGEGTFAKVYQATWLGCKYAVKRFRSQSSISEAGPELKLLIELRHICIVRLMGLSVDSERRCSIVMEFMGGDLRELIKTRMKKRKTIFKPVHVVPFDLNEAVHIIKRIAQGMRFLHYRDVVHRDLKASNVLVPHHPGSIDVKIADFGLSQFIDPSGESSAGHVGSRYWRAPELLPLPGAESSGVVEEDQPMRDGNGDEPKRYDLKAADVYSFAMTCYEVLSGEVPLADEDRNLGQTAVKLAVIRDGLRPTLPADLNSDLKQLIEECWVGKPEKRPNFSSICEKLQTIQDRLRSSIS